MTGLCTQCNADIIGQMGWSGLTSVGAIRAPGSVPAGVGSFLLETHWMYWTGLFLLAAAAVYVGRSRGQRGALRLGAIVAGLAVVWACAAMLVDTPSERLDAAHRAVLEAAERKDVAAIVAHLAPGFRSEALGITAQSKAGDEIGRLLGAYGIRSNRVESLKIVLHYPDAATTIRVRTDIENVGNVETTWDLDWEDEAGTDWKIGAAHLVRVGSALAPEGAIPK